MKNLVLALMLALMSVSVIQSAEITKVRLHKSDRKLLLIDKNGKTVKEYSVMLGRQPIGAKEMQGDNKTPEGAYILDYKNLTSKYYKSIHVNYPNKKDLINAKAKGIKDPGDSIMIHGLPNNFKPHIDMLKSLGLDTLADNLIRLALPYIDWTQGCIALVDKDMEEIYQLVKTPTAFFIYP